MTTINRLLYATDLSPISEPAWNEARRLGRLFDAEILFLHVVAPPLVFPVEGYFPPQMYQELVRSARRDAEKGFDRLLAAWWARASRSGSASRRGRRPSGSSRSQLKRLPISWSSELTAARASSAPFSEASLTGSFARRRARS